MKSERIAYCKDESMKEVIFIGSAFYAGRIKIYLTIFNWKAQTFSKFWPFRQISFSYPV